VSIELDECMSRGHACQGVTHVTGSGLVFCVATGKAQIQDGEPDAKHKTPFRVPSYVFLGSGERLKLPAA
jgi:hypothetical protein